MTKTFTQDDLIRFYYNDTSDLQTKEIKDTLLIDIQLADEYKKLASLLTHLDEVEEKPSDRTVQNILSYSKSINLHSINE